MTIRLFDTATRTVRDFVPNTPGKVGLYVCGATVQSPPHIGHMRSAVAFDVLNRWLTRSGFDVTYIRNVTDIDDKILAKSLEAGYEWWAWANLNEHAFSNAYASLGNLLPTYEPRATGHMPDMIALLGKLIERGHAYVASPGNVYFDTQSWPDYGTLTNQHLDDVLSAGDEVEQSEKRNPRDFALWKASKPGEPATTTWQTPFGAGRPGWHLECSAMAWRFLGENFDIHGGGLDLRFPHHENEQAQSHAAGFKFTNYWMHSAWVTQGGTKMSKSLGNGLLVTEVLARTRAVVLRYALASVHYRSMLEWTDETIAESTSTWDRFEGFVTRATEAVGAVPKAEITAAELPQAFTTAMHDDLNVANALAVVHEHLKAGNSGLADKKLELVRTELIAVRAMLDILGLDPQDWVTSQTDTRATAALESLVAGQLAARAQARADRDFATSDAIRDNLAGAGIVVEDSATGARWSLAAPSTEG